METEINVMMEKAKAISDETLKANAEELVNLMTFEVEGVEGARAYTPPYIRLVQGITVPETYPDKAHLGDYVIGFMPDAIALPRPVKAIPISLFDSRTYWDPDKKDEPKSLCASPDGIQGRLGICKSCPHSKFEEGKGSDCTKSVNILWVTSDLKHIFFQSAAKTSLKTGQAFKTTFTKKGVQPFLTECLIDSKTNDEYKNVKQPVFAMNAKITDKEVGEFTTAVFRYFSASRKAFISSFKEGLPSPESQPPGLISNSGEQTLVPPGSESGYTI